MIAVTGATGFVGREVLRQALALNTPLRALTRHPVEIPGVTDLRVVGDLIDPLPADVFEGCEAVIHCAARAHILRDRDADPETAFLRANCDAAVSVAESAAMAGVRRFVFVSSIKVVGEQTQPGAPFRPDDAPAPQDAYARSKAAAERELKAVAHRTGLELVIVRPPLVHGPGVRGNLGALIRAIDHGFPLPFGKISNRRSLVQVENLADLLLEAALHPKAAGQTLHVADEEPISTPALANAIADGLGVKVRLVAIPPRILTAVGRLVRREGVINRLIDSLEVDASSTTSLLNWRPHLTSYEGLRRMGAAAR